MASLAHFYGFGGLQVVRPQHLVAEDPALIDGLTGPDPAQIGGSVGGGHDQRDPPHPGLDHCGEHLGGGGAGGAHHQDRGPGGLGDPQPKEGRGALVEVGPIGEARLPGHGEGQRGAARSGGHTGVCDPQARQRRRQSNAELVGAVGHGPERYRVGVRRALPVAGAKIGAGSIEPAPAMIRALVINRSPPSAPM